jgi:hypothetical protein
VDALRELLSVLHARGVEALLFKGTAFAWTLYPAPHLRPRVDVDLLIRRDALAAAEDALRADRWTRDAEADAELASSQRHYSKPIGRDRVERLDLHWRIVNPLSYARGLSFDEMWVRSAAVPGLGPSARTLAPADALLASCVHLVAHHQDQTGDLLWLLDVHRQAAHLGDQDRQLFLVLAARTAMADVCRLPVAAAAECFRGRAASDLARALSSLAPCTSDLARPAAPVRRLVRELALMPGWRARSVLLVEHLFPSLRYVRSRYPRWPAILLPLAWMHRIVVGAPRWFRNPGRPAAP